MAKVLEMMHQCHSLVGQMLKYFVAISRTTLWILSRSHVQRVPGPPLRWHKNDTSVHLVDWVKENKIVLWAISNKIQPRMCITCSNKAALSLDNTRHSFQETAIYPIQNATTMLSNLKMAMNKVMKTRVHRHTCFMPANDKQNKTMEKCFQDKGRMVKEKLPKRKRWCGWWLSFGREYRGINGEI